MKKILIISPHADDETLGAGGYLLKHRDLKDEIYWINVTNANIKYGYTKQEQENWEIWGKRVSDRYGVKKYIDLKLEPAGLDKINKSTLIQIFSDLIKEIKPNIILLPFQNDVHSDHRIVFETAYACTKAFRYPYIEKIICMEIISKTDYAVSTQGFVPNYFVDISKYMDEKISIMREYSSEIKESPFPRNEKAIKGLAKYRAAACNAEYAEAFYIMKEIEH